jgi:hypothetical protein
MVLLDPECKGYEKEVKAVAAAAVAAASAGGDHRAIAKAASEKAIEVMEGEPPEKIDAVYFEGLRLYRAHAQLSNHTKGGRRRLTRRKRKGTRRH